MRANVMNATDAREWREHLAQKFNNPALDGRPQEGEEEEFDPETMCGVRVDGPEDGPCGKPKTRIAIEPFTPGRFKTECCEDCFKSFRQEGYFDGGRVG